MRLTFPLTHSDARQLTPPSPLALSRTATACIAGALAGILGLTNLAGFALYLATSVSVGAAYAVANCGTNPGRYFVKPSEPLVAGTLGNCFSFILFWTRAFALSSLCMCHYTNVGG